MYQTVRFYFLMTLGLVVLAGVQLRASERRPSVAETPSVASEQSPPAAAREESEILVPASTQGSEDWREGVWLSRNEISGLPVEGSAWFHVNTMATRHWGSPNLSDQDQNDNVYVLAKALVWARTGHDELKEQVQQACLHAMGTEEGGRTLALGRELAAYVMAADIVGLAEEDDARFRAWLRQVLSKDLEGRTLRSTHEDRPNNWGTHAGASRAAVATYLRDRRELERCAQVFRGWVGERDVYSSFRYGKLWWQADESTPVGINPIESVRDGLDVSGALPEEMRRGGMLSFPPRPTGYAWEALQGAFVQAEILWRQGFDAYEWGDRALLRAVEFLGRLDAEYPGQGWWAHGDDEWIVWLVNARYGTDFPTALPARSGKNMGWTDWTHAPRSLGTH